MNAEVEAKCHDNDVFTQLVSFIVPAQEPIRPHPVCCSVTLPVKSRAHLGLFPLQKLN